jgi:hypothetical protein
MSLPPVIEFPGRSAEGSVSDGCVQGSGFDAEVEVRDAFRQCWAAHARLLRLLELLDQTQDYPGAEAGLAPHTFVARLVGIAPRTASGLVRSARELSAFAPEALEYLAAGVISPEAARLIGKTCAQVDADVVAVRKTDPDHVFTDVDEVPFEPVTKTKEDLLALKVGAGMRDDHVGKASRAILAFMVPEREQARRAALEARRSVRLSQTFDGVWHLDGLLDEVTGTRLATLLDAASEAPQEGDTRSGGQRRHDTFAELLALLARRVDADDSVFDKAGQRSPHIRLTAHHSNLTSAPAGRVPVRDADDWLDLQATTDLGSRLSPAGVRELFCPATVRPILLGGALQEALYAGQARRFPTDLQRDAVTARDRHCQYPGCDRPPRWLDIHHRIAWQHGGRTDIDKPNYGQGVHLP